MAAPKAPKPIWDFDFEKYMSDLKVPGMDPAAFLEAQRKNMEAMAAANQTALDGMQTVMRRQAELMQQMTEDANSLGASLLTPEAPQARMARQAEMTKKQFEKSLANMKEVAEMVGKSQGAVSDIITSRISEALEEVRSAAEKKS